MEVLNEKRLVFYIYNYILYDIICFCLIFKVVYPFYRRVQVYMDIYFKSRITLLILMGFYCVFQYIKQDTVYFIDISTILGFGDRKVPIRTLLRIKINIPLVLQKSINTLFQSLPLKDREGKGSSQRQHVDDKINKMDINNFFITYYLSISFSDKSFLIKTHILASNISY